MDIEQAAYGPLALTPQQLWRLTPAELSALMAGYNWRQEREWERTAWVVAYLLTPHVTRPLTVDQLLGRERVRTEADKQQDFQVLWGRLHPMV